MATTAWLAGLRHDMDHAVELVPPHWVGNGELSMLEARFEPLQFERFADGTLLVTPPTGGLGSLRSNELVHQITAWSKRHGLGVTFGANAGFTSAGDALFSPDATYIERTRWDALSREAREGFPALIPDAAFEVLSKSDRASAIRRKVATYLRDGVRLVVMIDPYRRRTYVGRAGDRDAVDVGDVTEVDCAPVMPGLMLNVAAILDVG